MRLVMMGTGPFAVPTFRWLCGQTSHQVVALITRPAVTAKTHGRVQAAPNPMREAAAQLQIAVHDPESINSTAARELLTDLRPDLFVVCDYGQILAAEILAIPPWGAINLHGSLLPKYRGAAPIQWAVWHGDDETGVSVIHMTPRLDAGPILVQRAIPIGPRETAEELEPRLAELGVGAVAEGLQLLANWDRQAPLGKPQDRALVSKAPRLRKQDGELDWRRTARDLVHQFRAVQPWPGAFTFFSRGAGEPLRLKLEAVEVADDGPPLAPGALATTASGLLLVGTGQGNLLVSRVQPAGRRAMGTGEFLRGNPLTADSRFLQPAGSQAQ